MAKKEDFILMTNSNGVEVLIHIDEIKFIIEDPEEKGLCNFFFGGGDDDYISIKTGLEEFLDLI